MKTNRLNHRQHQASGLLAGLALACAGAASAQAPWYTSVKPYAVAVSPDYVLQPLLSVGDQVPNTSDPSKVFQMIGIPDGLGATKGKGNTTLLYMNHELGTTVLSEPNVGGPLNRGAFVSRWTLDKNGSVISGERAYNTVRDEETGHHAPRRRSRQYWPPVRSLLLRLAVLPRGRLRPSDLPHRRRERRRRDFRRQRRPRRRGLRQRAPHPREDGPLRLGEHPRAS